MLREYKQEFELILTDAETQLFDMKRVKFVEESDADDLSVTWFMTCDLAFSEKSGADYSALTCVGVDKDGGWYVYPVAGRWKPSETANQIFRLINRFNILDVYIEQGASMIAVKEHLERLQLDYQSYFGINELKHGGNSKISISALEPVVNAGRMTIIDNGDAAEMLVEQMELTDHLTVAASHDDLIDSLAYMVQVSTYHSDNSNDLPSREDYEESLLPVPDAADKWMR